MKNSFIIKLISAGLLSLLAVPVVSQPRNCLRVMPVDELTRYSSMIARVRVVRVDKSSYRGYSQIAMLQIVDVIEGDTGLKEVNVLARSSVRCAEDNYSDRPEMLVFLVPEDSLFHTLNFQYGQFPIAGEVVRGWRDKMNRPVDKPYAEVRQEIEGYINGIYHHQPDVNTPPATPPPAQAKRPPESSVARPRENR